MMLTKTSPLSLKCPQNPQIPIPILCRSSATTLYSVVINSRKRRRSCVITDYFRRIISS